MKEIRTIVIDPGHGGENLGTIANPAFEEKDITFLTAQTIYEELSKYEELEVYMTRTEDVDLSLKDRAKFAEKVDADMVFSIHYNASESHRSFGAELWVPLDAPGNATGYHFGEIFLSKMQDMGLHLRGIKTRESEETPGSNYYGIIRECHKREIPAVILEHCYVDAGDDVNYVDSEEDIIAFGKADAQAILEFVGLAPHAKEYESINYPLEEVVSATIKDVTPPDYCDIQIHEADYDNGLLTLQVTASDMDSTLLYYDYTVDGGKSYSELFAWPESNVLTGEYADSFVLTLSIEHKTVPEIFLRAYNAFDVPAESNTINQFEGIFLDPVVVQQEKELAERLAAEQEELLNSYETVVLTMDESSKLEKDSSNLMFLGCGIAAVLLIFAFFLFLFHRSQKRKDKR